MRLNRSIQYRGEVVDIITDDQIDPVAHGWACIVCERVPRGMSRGLMYWAQYHGVDFERIDNAGDSEFTLTITPQSSALVDQALAELVKWSMGAGHIMASPHVEGGSDMSDRRDGDRLRLALEVVRDARDRASMSPMGDPDDVVQAVTAVLIAATGLDDDDRAAVLAELLRRQEMREIDQRIIEIREGDWDRG